MDRFDIELLDDNEPFEIDDQLPHLFKHGPLGLDDARDVWAGDPLFYPARPPADWLMVGEVPGGTVLVVPLMPGKKSMHKARPIGVYPADRELDAQYRVDRR